MKEKIILFVNNNIEDDIDFEMNIIVHMSESCVQVTISTVDMFMYI